jgi:ABC-type uncharacterized transport system fused permease/ATPase subunit
MFGRILVGIVILGTISVVAYQLGMKQANLNIQTQKTASYNTGYEAGKKYTELFPATSGMYTKEEYDKLAGEYNQVLDQYNNLINQVNSYTQTSYQPRQSIWCSTSNIGNYSSTWCY